MRNTGKQVKVENITPGDVVQGEKAGLVIDALNGGAQVRLTFDTGADVYYKTGTLLHVESN